MARDTSRVPLLKTMLSAVHVCPLPWSRARMWRATASRTCRSLSRRCDTLRDRMICACILHLILCCLEKEKERGGRGHKGQAHSRRRWETAVRRPGLGARRD